MSILLHRRGIDLETEADAYAFLEQLRWGDDGPTECPHCRSTKGAWFLKPKDPAGRRSKGGSSARSQRRVWKCRENSCRRQFSVLTNTVMHATKMPVRAWVDTIFELCDNPNGTSAREVAERWELTSKSAWALLERIQSALALPADDDFFSGAAPRWIEVADESDHVVIDAREPARAAPDVPAASPDPATADLVSEAADRVRSDVEQLLAEAFADSSIQFGSHLVPPRYGGASAPHDGSTSSAERGDGSSSSVENHAEQVQESGAREDGQKERRRRRTDGNAQPVDNSSESGRSRPRESPMEPSPDGRTKATRPARNNRRPQDAQSGDRLGAGWLADALSDDAKDAGPASKSTPPAAAQPDLGLGPQWARSDPAPDDPNPAIADPQTAVPTSTRRAGGSS